MRSRRTKETQIRKVNAINSKCSDKNTVATWSRSCSPKKLEKNRKPEAGRKMAFLLHKMLPHSVWDVLIYC